MAVLRDVRSSEDVQVGARIAFCISGGLMALRMLLSNSSLPLP